MTELKPHCEILSSLFNIYKNSEDELTLKNASSIAWNLGVNLNYDFGYHELSELIQGKLTNNSEGEAHYLEVIVRNLSKLKN